MTDIKDYQMWKLDENLKTIVSKFNNGIIGIDGNSILSAYTGDGDMVGTVSVDTTTSSNYDFKFTGLYIRPKYLLSVRLDKYLSFFVTECPDEPELSPDGKFVIVDNYKFTLLI